MVEQRVTPGSGFRSPWGKTGDGSSHHLAHHCADVAACFEAILDQPVVRARMECSAGRQLSQVDVSRLAMLAFLHDCGKLHPGFQAKGWPTEVWPRGSWHGHVREGAAIFAGAMDDQLAEPLHIEKLAQWGVNRHLLYAVLAHHGRPFQMDDIAEKQWVKVAAVEYDPVRAAREIGALLPRWFAKGFEEDGAQMPNSANFQHLLCGMVSLADWLGSTRPPFDFVADLDPQYMDVARRKARSAVAEIGLDVSRWRRAISGRTEFSTLAPGRSPRAAQSLVGNWSLQDQLIILEAETGSGKTEAALWRFARLFEAGLVDSLYFALPTRAAAKQIHGRVNDAMNRLFGRGAPEAVLAVPGYLKSGEVEGVTLPGYEVRWDDDDRKDERLQLARWAAEHAKRYLAAAVAVGTVDQAMLAGLQVKHSHLRAAALSRSFLVIDEVHASDPYMTAVQAHLLDMHLSRGGQAMLMSATLGAVARTQWLAGNRTAPPSFDAAQAAPYPAVWGRGSAGPTGIRTAERQKRLRVLLASTWAPAEAAQRAIDAAKDGARVLVIRNTVTAALETFAEICASGREPLLWQVAGGSALHHSRFAAEDRRLLDQEVQRALSPQIGMPDGTIVIGTQTLEQSLDIDADILVTDLCPVDVLLQRIGRLHRHDRKRPSGFETPVCVVLAPAEGLDRLTAPGFENGLGRLFDGGGVYCNLHACELTRRLILDCAEWAIPEMNRFLVESATHPERIEALSEEKGKAWGDYWNSVYGRNISEKIAAHQVALPLSTDFANVQFPDKEEKIRTRLGAEGARVVFDSPLVGPFGVDISEVVLPAHFSRGIISTEERIRPTREGDGLRFEIGETAFRYSRKGLEREKEK